MKMLRRDETKKGMASLYVVLFATILFGVITLSFVRIIISEVIQSSNDDLSQSAYDSALVGVEDAKIAVNRYYQCLSRGGEDCGRLFNGTCDDFYLKHYLGYDYEGEVLVQESLSNNSDQAYTCVILKNVVSDYRSTLTSDTRTRVVPIGIDSNTLSQVKEIEFQWYSDVNGTEKQFRGLDNSGKLAKRNDATTPPTISLTLLKTGSSFSLSDFNNSTSPDYSTMILLPSSDEHATNIITQAEVNRAGDSDKDGDLSGANEPFLIKCGVGEFACSVRLTDLNFAAGGNAMLVVSLPYGDIVTDFAVTMKRADGSAIELENVQISVDSTGRANQLIRRVETRLDIADIFFPYPQYEVELTGSDENSFWKNFWITANCWTENGRCDNNGNL